MHTLQGTATDRTKLFILDTNLIIKKQKILDHQQNSLALSYVTQINGLAQGDIIGTGWTDFNYLGALDLYAIRFDTSLSLPDPLGFSQIPNYVPKYYNLFQNFPNPFNPETRIKFNLPKEGKVSIKIFDVLGRIVYTKEEYEKAGSYELTFDGSSLASGVYFYRIESGGFVDSKKMVLIR